jgi:hypothetical protein
MPYILKRDLLIPAGTVFERSPNRMIVQKGKMDFYESKILSTEKTFIITVMRKDQPGTLFEWEEEKE